MRIIAPIRDYPVREDAEQLLTKDLMRESPLVEEWLNEGRLEGRIKGRQEGVLEGERRGLRR